MIYYVFTAEYKRYIGSQSWFPEKVQISVKLFFRENTIFRKLLTFCHSLTVFKRILILQNSILPRYSSGQKCLQSHPPLIHIQDHPYGEQENGRNSINFLAEWDVQKGVRCKQMCFIKGFRNYTMINLFLTGQPHLWQRMWKKAKD